MFRQGGYRRTVRRYIKDRARRRRRVLFPLFEDRRLCWSRLRVAQLEYSAFVDGAVDYERWRMMCRGVRDAELLYVGSVVAVYEAVGGEREWRDRWSYLGHGRFGRSASMSRSEGAFWRGMRGVLADTELVNAGVS